MKTVVRPRPAATQGLATLLVVAVCAIVPARAEAFQQAAAALPQAAVNEDGGRIIDRVLVRVGDRAILYSDFEAELADRMTAIAAQLPQDQIDAQMPAIRMSLMVAMVEESLLEMHAEELGITASPNEIDRAIANMREQYGLQDDNQWQQALAQSGLTEAMLREQASGSIVQQRMMQQEIRVFVSAGEVATYYENNRNLFTEPEQVLYQQIVFVYQGADRAPVRERAENALAELRAGSSLTAVGAKYAIPNVDLVQDASTAGWISPEDIQQEVRTIVADLTPLAYSDIIEGRFGYHIIQLMDRKEGRVIPLEEVAPQVRAQLQDQKAAEQLQKYTQELMQDVSLEIYADEFLELPNAWTESQGAPTGPTRQR